MKKLLSLTALIGLLVALSPANAFAHVTVTPNQVKTGAFQSFSVAVPNEKDIPTVKVKLQIPNSLKYVTPNVKTGWQIDVEKDGTGEDATVKSITWSGGAVTTGLRDDFTFSAQVPAEATNIEWKAYQTYQDGTVVSWDKAGLDEEDSDSKSSGPLSVTKVVSLTTDETAGANAQRAADSAKSSSRQALFLGAAALIIGLAAIALSTRKPKA